MMSVQADIVPIGPEQLPRGMTDVALSNAACTDDFKKSSLSKDDLELFLFMLAKTEKNRFYYDYYRPMSDVDEEDFIFASIELQTESIFSNCDKLLIELILGFGLTPEDCAEKQSKYLTYYQFLEEYRQIYKNREGGVDLQAWCQ